MKSPFPGVDPYLESQGVWTDFHGEFIYAWRRCLLDVLPDDYDARTSEHVYIIHGPGESKQHIIPDVALEELPDSKRIGGGAATAVAAQSDVETFTIPLPETYEVRESYIKILKHPERTLVAVLEALSPTNKGSERRAYLEKRDEVLGSAIHLVELDLLLGGQRLPMRKPLPTGHYYAIVSCSEKRPDAEVTPWTVRRTLPTIAIPLADPGAQVKIDLQQVFETAYERGGFDRAIDYDKPLSLPLAQAELDWAQDQAAGQLKK